MTVRAIPAKLHGRTAAGVPRWAAWTAYAAALTPLPSSIWRIAAVNLGAPLLAQMPGATAVMEPGAPEMHTTDSLDYVLVVSGEATLELDDGDQTVLRAGDVVIQNGTRHAWRNHGAGPCTIVGVAIGAERTRPA
ncbi:cupin domain-containing protein [Sphaerisporangium fuscum]|uniref:cupin domain-containing protein n=1 Tax=Sphaerisporangium fuscum TaxID=2835868 RepID=UPI001BDBE92A|nr:cupin domain-containing protein [Sphaerisporangium fuscum]